jgi:EAL and modified HD-GYP domain-containing signal transduction protein
MFSLIDAVIDRPMEKILEELPLSGQIKSALISAKGKLAAYIELARSYETGRWNRVSRLARAMKLDEATLPTRYLQACEWSDISSRSN